MGEPAERHERLEHRAHRQLDGVPEGKGRERIGDVVASGERKAVASEQPPGSEGEPGIPVVVPQAKVAFAGLLERKGDLPASGPHHRPHPGVTGVDHGHGRPVVNPALGGRVLFDVPVAIQVVGGHVEDHRGRGTQRTGTLELEARKLQHVELGPAAQERQGGLAEVGADLHRPPGALRHVAHHRRHGALSVRAGDRDHRRVGGAGKELDVADDRHPSLRRRRERRFPKRDSRIRHDQIDVPETGGVEPSAVHLDPGVPLPHEVETRRRRARIDYRYRDAHRTQVLHARHSGLPQADDERGAGRRRAGPVALGSGVGCQCHALLRHRIFRVARPMRTKITVSTQKRTMTRGSGQPFSSKWWCSGAMRKTRRPVILKEAT